MTNGSCIICLQSDRNLPAPSDSARSHPGPGFVLQDFPQNYSSLRRKEIGRVESAGLVQFAKLLQLLSGRLSLRNSAYLITDKEAIDKEATEPPK